MRRTGIFPRMFCALGTIVSLGVGNVVAQGDRFETKVPFKLDQSLNLDAKVGPVRFSTVKITSLGRGYGRGSIGLKPQASELSTTLRLAFDVNNPGEDWVITYTVEFLDRNGKPIDRATKREGYEGETKITNLDHPILEYIVPLIADVRITLNGRLD